VGPRLEGEDTVMTKLGFQVLNAGPLATREHVVEPAPRAR